MIFAARFQARARVCCPEVTGEKGRKGIMVPSPLEFPLSPSLPPPALLFLLFPPPFSHFATGLFVPVSRGSLFSLILSYFFTSSALEYPDIYMTNAKNWQTAAAEISLHVACKHDPGREKERERSVLFRTALEDIGISRMTAATSRSRAWFSDHHFQITLFTGVNVFFMFRAVSPSDLDETCCDSHRQELNNRRRGVSRECLVLVALAEKLPGRSTQYGVCSVCLRARSRFPERDFHDDK